MILRRPSIIVALSLVLAAGRSSAAAEAFRLEPNLRNVTLRQVVQFAVTPPLDAAAGDLFVTVAGQQATVESAGSEHVRVQIPQIAEGPAEVRLIVISRDPKAPHRTGTGDVIVVGQAKWQAWVSLAIVVVLLVATLALLYRATPKTNADAWNRVMFLVYDDRTDSYSVKRLQAVLWFAAVLPIVLFAFVLTQFRSGAGAWVILPANVLFLLGTSAGTAVVAEGIERMQHARIKSSDKRAAWRDLFQDNEGFSFSKFQIICWTIVTCVFFIATYAQHAWLDPTTIPDIPQNYWLLMGLSSATYVGAKLADTGAGAPQILSAVLTPAPRQLIIRAQDIALRFDMTPEGWFTVDGTDPAGKAQQVTLAASGMVTQQLDGNKYRITVPLTSGALTDASGASQTLDFTKEVRIHVTNPDGQISAAVTLTC